MRRVRPSPFLFSRDIALTTTIRTYVRTRVLFIYFLSMLTRASNSNKSLVFQCSNASGKWVDITSQFSTILERESTHTHLHIASTHIYTHIYTSHPHTSTHRIHTHTSHPHTPHTHTSYPHTHTHIVSSLLCQFHISQSLDRLALNMEFQTFRSPLLGLSTPYSICTASSVQTSSNRSSRRDDGTLFVSCLSFLVYGEREICFDFFFFVKWVLNRVLCNNTHRLGK